MKKITKWLTILVVSTKLGLISFGGPTAHLAYFYDEYVKKKKWIDAKSYSELVALAQFLPGPASSQVGIGIGIVKGGLFGGLLSFIGFTFPSVLVLTLFALFFNQMTDIDMGWIQGLKLVAVVIVAHALIGMVKALTPNWQTKLIAIASFLFLLFINIPFSQVIIILITAFIGYMLFNKGEEQLPNYLQFPISKKVGAISLVIFGSLLVVLPMVSSISDSTLLTMFDSFYRSGALVFGGGHVVLPLLEIEVLKNQWMSEEVFLAGYGLTQAVPGPLFTFAAYLGAIINGWLGSLIATVAIFLPAFLLIVGALPFWNTLKQNKKMRSALIGINAGVVGILLASFIDPIVSSTVTSLKEITIVVILFYLLNNKKVKPYWIVLLGLICGLLFY